MDSNAVFAVLLLIVGLAILTAEIFIPSGGLLGLITFISLIVSLVFAYRAWGESHSNIFGAFCVLLLLLVPTVVGMAFYLLPRTALGKRVLLEAPELQELTPFAKEVSRLEQLVGDFGVATTLLNPGGLVSLNGQRLHAISEGLFVEPGTSVEIVGVQGNCVVVRPGVPVEPDADENDLPSEKSKSPLDFDFPPNT